MDTVVKNIDEYSPWKIQIVQQEDNLTYVVINEKTLEALVIDPAKEDWNTLCEITAQLKKYHFLAVIETHTHADHISCAADLSNHLNVPLIMQEKAPSKKVHIRISRETTLPTVSGPLKFIMTPGHTPDSMTVLWGPFVFTGDTVLFEDVGRDDLPGGNATTHYESLVTLKEKLDPKLIMCTNHDGKARISTWEHQLKHNSSLTQEREAFIAECGSYNGPSPKRLKESLFENFK